MQGLRIVCLVVGCVALAAGAAADTKVVKVNHTDAFTMMGKKQPASDEEHTIWFGEDRMRVDQGTSSFIVRADLGKMYIVNHKDKQYYSVDLPVDFGKLLPAEMASQMMEMMKFEAKVTPTDQTKKVGEWTARRWDATMKSAMTEMKMEIWATQDVDLDFSVFKKLVEHTQLLAPGMDQVVKEMSKVEGFQVESSTSMTVMGNTMTSSERTVSVEKSTPPAGAYDPPAGYKAETFDFMKMQRMQNR